jgi:hypothetical protein
MDVPGACGWMTRGKQYARIISECLTISHYNFIIISCQCADLCLCPAPTVSSAGTRGGMDSPLGAHAIKVLIRPLVRSPSGIDQGTSCDSRFIHRQSPYKWLVSIFEHEIYRILLPSIHRDCCPEAREAGHCPTRLTIHA